MLWMGFVGECVVSAIGYNVLPKVDYQSGCMITFIIICWCLSDISGIQYRVLNRKKGPAVWVRMISLVMHVQCLEESQFIGFKGTDRQRPIP